MDLSKPDSQRVGIFFDNERDPYRSRVVLAFLAELSVSRGSIEIFFFFSPFLKWSFFLSWAGPTSFLEDISKATSLTMSQKLSRPPGESYLEIYQVACWGGVTIKENKV